MVIQSIIKNDFQQSSTSVNKDDIDQALSLVDQKNDSDDIEQERDIDLLKEELVEHRDANIEIASVSSVEIVQFCDDDDSEEVGDTAMDSTNHDPQTDATNLM